MRCRWCLRPGPRQGWGPSRLRPLQACTLSWAVAASASVGSSAGAGGAGAGARWGPGGGDAAVPAGRPEPPAVLSLLPPHCGWERAGPGPSGAESQFLTAPCPEVLKSEPYWEKVDVWAAGCILYQMATLSPPFYSTNMFSLATKIVEAVYEPVPEGVYSEKVTTTITRCLTLDAEARPDIVEVSSTIADVMMKYFDSLSTSQLALEKKLEGERRRTQRYFMEANRNAVTCQHEPALLSHETFEKASLSSSSSGAGSLKSELSESSDLPPEGFQAPCGKDEDRACDGILSDDTFNLENIDKHIYSELDDELDILDNSSISSSSPLKESTFSTLKRSFSASGGERQSQTRSPVRADPVTLNQKGPFLRPSST
ncbi:serine/threonine-protein kinase Nek10-like [Vicugna pacos]|uniref:Serine/threonine-protein kinase Nek10-like n=1 Tax=Vicugna pacos TaxID=30538 RepID=A0ABM5BKN8_VICPA